MVETYFNIREIEGKKYNFLSFKILENAGNGDCLFISIMQFLEHEKIYEPPNNVANLRLEIVNYILHSSNWNRFVDTIIFNSENLLPSLVEKKYSDDFKRKEYHNFMSQQSQYGTFAELQAASEIFHFHFIVFRKELQTSEEESWYSCYTSEDHKSRTSSKSKMFLFFTGKPSSGHFQFMRPILPEHIVSVPQGHYKTIDRRYGSNNSLVISVKKTTKESCESGSNRVICSECGNYK